MSEEIVLKNEVPEEAPLLKKEWLPKKSKRKPIGYHNPDSNFIYQPNFPVLKILEETLDQLDNGISLREATDFFNAHVPPEDHVSHMGLKKIRERERPDFVRKISKPKPKKHIPREERKQIIRSRKAGAMRRQIIAAEKRIAKIKGEQSDLREIEALKTKPIFETPVYEIELPTVIQKRVEETPPIFQASAGPQTMFLAASEQEVLYGGAAGGELKSEFYRLLFS